MIKPILLVEDNALGLPPTFMATTSFERPLRSEAMSQRPGARPHGILRGPARPLRSLSRREIRALRAPFAVEVGGRSGLCVRQQHPSQGVPVDAAIALDLQHDGGRQTATHQGQMGVGYRRVDVPQPQRLERLQSAGTARRCRDAGD